MFNAKFEQHSKLTIHIQTVHENLRPFDCPLCPAKFGEKGSLSTHIRMVHENLRPFKCKLCPAKFGHTVKPYLTVTCEQRPPVNNGKFESSTTSLNISFIRHLWQRPLFQVPRVAVVHRFDCIGNLSSHVKTVHENLKPFECQFCPLKFGQKGNLKAHVQRMHINKNKI